MPWISPHSTEVNVERFVEIYSNNFGYIGGGEKYINPTLWVNNSQLHESIRYSNVCIAFHGPIVNSIA